MVSTTTITRANGQETKAKLLRTTETLFASKGVAGVTMRSVAEKAQTNLASAHYHFGSKEAMVLEMIKSKIEPINLKRRERLKEAKIKFSNKPLPNIEIFRALVHPVGEEVEKQITNKNGIIEIIARSFTEPAEFLNQIQKRFFGELSQVFITELKNSNPNAKEEDLYWNYHLAVSSMLGTLAQHRRMIDFSVGKYNEVTVSAMIDRLIIFISNGFEAGIQIKK